MIFKNTQTKIISLVVLTMFLFTICWWSVSYAQGLLPSVAETINRLKSLAKDKTSLASLFGQLNEIADKKIGLDQLVLTKDTLVNLMERLDELATKSGVALSISSVSTSNYVVSLSYKEEFLNIKLAANGSYDNVMRFVRIIESLPQRAVIKNIRIAKSGGVPIPVSGGALPVPSAKNQNVSQDWVADITFDVLGYVNK
ncbi:MAG: hypothetical protein WC797_00565 [Candidatus Paceibacterota bacterium]|jgi:Tfp pilus assembly protein PilO